MIDIERVSFTYGSKESSAPAKVPDLEEVDLRVHPGESVLLCGTSGCGKSTVLRLVNGLVPHFHPGALQGRVTVDGLDVPSAPLHLTGARVATVFQNPRTQFFTAQVRDELAFGPENYGTDPAVIRSHVAQASQRTGATDLLDACVFHLSGGQKQLVACTAAMVAQPQVYLFDEPTSNLSSEATTRLREVMLDLRASGATMIVAEHRLAYLRDVVDRAVLLDGGRVARKMSAAELWSLSDQERAGLGLRTLEPVAPSLCDLVLQTGSRAVDDLPDTGVVMSGIDFSYGRHRVLDIPRLVLPRGQVTALVGPNGAGKSTLVRVLVGLERSRGTITLDGKPLRAKDRSRLGYVVMQDVHRQLFGAEVREELTLGLKDPDAARVDQVLAEHGLSDLAGRHPMSLSGGQKQRLVIAAAQMVDKEIYVFDEPSSGLDQHHLQSTAGMIRSLAEAGKVVVIITHDEELLSACADRVVQLLPLPVTGSSARTS